MGRKKKEAQRTKGNVKPASSGHAAQLLEASGGFQSGFIGFESLSGDLGYVPVNVQAADAAECGDGELRMVMKRLTKRDAVTKLKALQNFSEICQERDSDVLTDALKYWPRIYSKLAIDYDHRVREAAHHALKEVASRSGRNLAPHLKQLIGAWLLSFCDSHAPAATAAKSAFQSVFSTETKSTEAVVYCHSELCKYISDMLYTATPETLSDSKTTSPVEMQEKYERILSSSLLCLRLVIRMCPAAKIPDLSQKCADILSQPSFWKFANNSNRMVKSSFFSLIGCLIKDMPELTNKHTAKICYTVLSRLGETDPVVCPSLWDAVERTLSIEKFWTHVNVQKTMLPGLWFAMEKGFDGNADSVATRLCLLLKSLPSEFSGSHRVLWNFFDHLQAGILLEKVQRSMKELNALMSAYHECLQFVIESCVKEGNESLIDSILSKHLFFLLWKSLTSSNQALSRSTQYKQFSTIIMGFGRELNSSGLSSSITECYSRAREMCWDMLRDLSKECVAAENSYTMNRFVQLLKCLVLEDGVGDSKKSNTKHVGFGSPSKKVKEAKASSHSTYTIVKPDHRLNKDHPELERTVELVASICVLCFQDESENFLSVHHAVLLCQLCGSPEFYNSLAQLQGGIGPAHIIDQCRTLLSKRPDDWLDVVKLILIITECTSSEQALSTLVKLSQALPWTNMYALLSLVQSADWLSDCMEAWLSQEQFREHTTAMKEALLNAIGERDVSAIRDGMSLFKLLMDISTPDGEAFSTICAEVQQSILENLSADTDVDIFELYCDCIAAMISHEISLDGHALVSHLYGWLTDVANKDAGPATEMAVALLRQVLSAHSDLLTTLISSIRQSLESAASNHLHFTLISSVSHQLSDCLSDEFIDLFVSEMLGDVDDSQLVKWLSIPAMRGLIPFDDVREYKSYLFTDLHTTYIPQVSAVLFISAYLTAIQQEVSSISTDLHKQLASVHSWLSYVVDISDSSSDTLISTQSMSCVEHWLSDVQKNKATCIDIFNGSGGALDGFAVQALASRLAEDSNMLLSSQATTYLSSFSTLSSANFACLHSISRHMCGADSLELMEMLAACIISTDPERVSATYTSLTGLLQVFTNLLERADLEDVRHQVHLLAILDFMSDVKSSSPQQLISEEYPYLDKIDSDRLALNVSLMRFYGQTVKKWSTALSSKQWDLILCMLDSWIGEEKCMLSADLLVSDSQLYASNVTSLLSVIGNVMKCDVTKQPSNYPTDFLSEWAELHALSIYTVLLPYFIEVSASVAKEHFTVQQSFVLGCLSNALTHCPAVCIKENQLEVKLVPDAWPQLPRNLETTLNHVVPLLLSPCTSIQSASYVLLNHVMSALPSHDKDVLEEDMEGRSPPSTLMSILDHCGPELLSLVGGARIGVDKPIHLQTNSDELCSVRAFLLTWRLLLKYLQYSSTQQMAEYSFYLKQNHYTADLLLLLFNLIPLEESLPQDGDFMFNVQLDLSGNNDMDEVVRIACSVYYNLIKVLPAVVRSWCTDVEKRANALLDRFTAKHVSPRLCMDEIEQIQTNSSLSSADNLTVKVRSAAREIVATYTLEEFSIELLIALPSNYPVGVASVECSKKLGVATNEWRKWMLQLTTFLTYQNGSVANAIDLWKKNLDKKFEGVEECYICFSVLHGSNLQLPKQQCKTCKKKFHSACLYKWFTSSQKSTCPLCRNLF